jgi:parallel beta-helix repeat protein
MKNVFAQISLLLGTTAALFGQGSLTPPGAPAPTMKTLQQVEPRTPISAAGFVITNPGSYYVTTNIVAAGGNGITIQADNVTVDLNGFALLGAGGSSGVSVSGARSNIVVRGGTIRGWGGRISAVSADGCRFEELQVSHNIGTAVRVANYATVRGCTIYTNGGFGVQASLALQISDCVVTLNGLRGIEGFDGCQVKNCIVRGNGWDGIAVSGGGMVLNCLSEYNGRDGISLDRGLVQDCTARNNTLDGIDVFINCRVIGNHCLQNGNGGDGAGIHSTQGGNMIEGNNVAYNDRGIDCNPSTGNLVIRNTAQGNGINYDVVAGNTLGPTVHSGNIATSTNPHANLQY